MNDELPRDVSGDLLAIPPNRIGGLAAELAHDHAPGWQARAADPVMPAEQLGRILELLERCVTEVGPINGETYRVVSWAAVQSVFSDLAAGIPLTSGRQFERARIAAELRPLAETVITDTGPVDYVTWAAVEIATQ